MNHKTLLLEHLGLTRRFFLRAGVLGVASIPLVAQAQDAVKDPAR